MESSTEKKPTLFNAFPAYVWNVEFTDRVILKITDEIADWRPPSPDGNWQFSLLEIAAHIVDAAQMFYWQITDVEDDKSKHFMKYPEDETGKWTHNRDFTLNDVKEKLAEIRSKWNEILNWDIEKAYIPTTGTIHQFEKIKGLAAEGKYPAEMLAYGAATPVRLLGTLISHEAQHRGTLIAYLRSYHGIDVSAKE